jgi:hypothetical protein
VNITIITDQAAWPYAEENEISRASGEIHELLKKI